MEIKQDSERLVKISSELKSWSCICWFWPLLFLLTLQFGNPPSLLLDSGWQEVLAFAYAHELRFGSELVFTYGPLGFLLPKAAYYPATAELFFYAQILLTLAQTLVICAAFHRMRHLEALLLAMAVALWPRFIPGDVQWYLTYAFAFVCIAQTSQVRWRWWMWTGLLFLLAIVALIKFTALVVFGLWVLLIAAMLWRHNSWHEALAFSAAAATLLCLTWALSGQTLADLSHYLLISFYVAVGYGSAMGQPMEASLLMIAICEGVGCLAILVASCWIGLRHPAMPWLMLFFFCLLFIVWHIAFTRPDHWRQFICFAGLLPFVAFCLIERESPRFTSIGGLCAVSYMFVALMLIDSGMARTVLARSTKAIALNIEALQDPQKFLQQRLNEWRALGETVHLPNIIATIGNERVDSVMIDQSMLLVIGANYAPRPIPQSYSAYTPELMRLNEAYFMSAQAPHFVVLRMQPIDGRIPMQEDGLALAVLLKRYRPRLFENGYLLLERTRSTVANFVPPALTEYSVGEFDQKIAVPEYVPAMIYIKIETSWFGRLRALVLSEPPVFLRIERASGKIDTLRLVRGTAVSGFLLAPLMTDARDWLNFPDGLKDSRVVSIIVTSLDARAFERDFSIAIVPFSGPFAIEDKSAFVDINSESVGAIRLETGLRSGYRN